MQVEDQAPRAVYVRLRQRARALRGLAIGFVALIALTLAFGTIPYFLAGSMAVTESRAALEMRRFEAEQNAKGVEKREGVEKRNRVAGETASADDAVGAGPTTAATGGAGGAPAHARGAGTCCRGDRRCRRSARARWCGHPPPRRRQARADPGTRSRRRGASPRR